MKTIIRFFKKLFGKYETEYEYWVYLKDIEITSQFQETQPRFVKMAQKYDWYCKHGEFQSPIRLTKNFVLVDGYTSYLLAKKFNLDKVPVYFVD